MRFRNGCLVLLIICLAARSAFAFTEPPKPHIAPINKPPRPALVPAADWPAWVAGAKQGVRTGVPQWVSMVIFRDGVVNGGFVTRGRLAGPQLYPLIFLGMKNSGAPDRIVSGFLGPVSDAWSLWAETVTVPSLPWYPSFAMFPGPAAPPMPSPPTSLIALSHMMTPLTPLVLSLNIRGRLGEDASSPAAQAAIEEFCTWFYSGFSLWLRVATIREVIGTGPVPTFAPPVVPAGPVVNGTANGGRISPPPTWP